jgi:hypothetical protein
MGMLIYFSSPSSLSALNGPQSLLEPFHAILLMPSLPMGDLTIAVAVISSFAFDTASLFAFGQIF